MVVVGLVRVDAAVAAVAANPPKLKDDFPSAAAGVPKLKPEEPPPPPMDADGFDVDPMPNPEKDDCAGGGFGAAVDEGAFADGGLGPDDVVAEDAANMPLGGVPVAVIAVDEPNAEGPPEADFGVVIGVTVTLPRLKGLVVIAGG